MRTRIETGIFANRTRKSGQNINKVTPRFRSGARDSESFGHIKDVGNFRGGET